MNTSFRNDPKWQEFSASLRKGQLFVKLPKTQAALIRVALLKVLKTLESSKGADLSESKIHLTNYTMWLSDEIEVVSAAYQASVVYAATIDCAKKDTHHIQKVQHLDETELLSKFHKCLEAGLCSDPEVDWISRVGGPRPDRKELETRSEPQDMSILDLEDLFPDS